MLKRLTVAVAALFALCGSAFASGTIPFSLSQQLDQYGNPLAGCFFYTIQAGTTSTPQNAFQDSALTIPLPNPQICDSAGRLPQMFLADGTIKVRLTDKNGVTVVVADNIQVIGASSGSGGGGTVDPTTILATGDMKIVYGEGVLSGFVRANGRTIGSATSGATERANADCQALFEYLWNTDANLTVSTGRGSTALADWTANKTITLPDMRGRTIAGLDDMGNSAASRLTSSYFGATATTLGAVGGGESQTLTLDQLPTGIKSSTSAGSMTISPSSNYITSDTVSTITQGAGTSATAFPSSATVSRVGPSISGTVTSTNTSGIPHRTVQPTILMTFYVKL